MKKSIVFIGGILLIVCGMFAVIAPDKLSMGVVAIMGIIVIMGFIFGIMPLLRCIGAFKQGVAQLDDVKKINSDNRWLPLSEINPFFGHRMLDELFTEYVEKAMEQREQGVVVSDIESVINDDALSVRSWRGVVQQISGTMTALGLLGTFLGLVTGISGVTYGTLQDTVAGIQTLLQGITTAFYTSIVGVILSIIFNAVYRIVWNLALRELQLFIESFHLIVQPKADDYIRGQQYLNSQQTIGYLSRIYDMGSKLMNTVSAAEAEEQRVMIEMLAGAEKDEFTFCLEPVCRLADRTVVKAEVNLRWNHEQLGTIHPDRYLPVIKANGYIVKLNTAMWEKVCAMLHDWIEKGYHPLPLVLKVTKTDILAMDIAAHTAKLIADYQLTPRNLEIAIDADAYRVCYPETIRTEKDLLQKGIKVTINGFDGDFLSLQETQADDIRLDLKAFGEDVSDETVRGAFEQAVMRHVNLSAGGIDSAKQLAQVKKAGCEYGRGEHLYQQLTRRELETLMDYR